MKDIKFSTVFPKHHVRAGQPTHFVEKIWTAIAENKSRFNNKERNNDMDMKTAYEVLKETGVYPEDFISMASVGGVEKAMETYAKQQNFQLIEALKQAKEALQKAENTIHRLYTYADMPLEDKSGWLKELRQALETINKLGL